MRSARYAVDVQRSAAGVAAARRAGAGWLAHEAGHDVDDAALVLAELLNNALMHSSGPIRLRLGWRAGVATVEVYDASPTLERRPSAPLDPHGRGLLVVEGLSDGWGVRPQGAGKVVWAHVREEPRRPARRHGHDRRVGTARHS